MNAKQQIIKLLFIFLLISINLLQAQTITIEGTITDANSSRTVEGVSVAIGDSMSVAEAGATTDEKGYYSFTIEANNRKSVKLLAQLTTYSNYEEVINLNNDKIRKNIVLKSNFSSIS